MSNKAEPVSTGPPLGAVACSALDAALALVDFGPCRDGDPADWINVASPMCAHCIGTEDVNLAAARIIAAEYRKAQAVIEFIDEIYIDGCDTYESWRGMGECARNHLSPNLPVSHASKQQQ